MRIGIVSMDTRGGIQPYLALGLGLRDAGHDVRVVAPATFQPLLEETGLPLAPLTGDIEATVRSLSDATGGGRAGMRIAARELAPWIRTWTLETLAGTEDRELITGGVGGMVLGGSVAEKLGVPFIPTHLQPIGLASSAYPGVLTAGVPHWLGPIGRRLSHPVSDLGVWLPFRSAMRSAREDVLGLGGRRRTPRVPVLYGFSRHVVPVSPRVAPDRHVTGYWFLPRSGGWSPPTGLESFLALDDRVVSIGFGSMASRDPAEVTALVRMATRDAGVRAVLLSGWGGMATPEPSDDLFVADAVPHDWLFERVIAAVHHGGAGTTAAVMRAGIPGVIVPFGVDQPFWAGRAQALGVSPPPIARSKLTTARLAASIGIAVANGSMRTRARELGARIRAEDGIQEAVRVLGAIASARSPRV